jgi:hypothetical protein
MLGSMGVNRWKLLLCTFTLAACSTHTVGASISPKDKPVTAKLLAAADAAARSNGGEAKRVEVVQTTRGKAANLTGHGSQNQGEAVWVVQVSGDHYVCGLCSNPGATVPKGDYITIVLRVSDYEDTDGGLESRATDLAAMGDVQVLRNDS